MAGSSSAGPKIKTVARARFLQWNSVAHHTLKTSRLKTVQVHWGQRDAFKRAGNIVQSCQLPLNWDMPKSSRGDANTERRQQNWRLSAVHPLHTYPHDPHTSPLIHPDQSP